MTISEKENREPDSEPIYGIETLIKDFDPVTLGELSENPLMDRYDEKYLLPVSIYAWLLPELIGHYRILEVGGVRSYRYVSTYLDTPALDMYLTHHNGWKNRYKVRFRRYVHSGKVYLEIKHKINKGKTFKKRLERPEEEKNLLPESRGFIQKYSPFSPDDLSPALRVSFARITLADPVAVERFTFDYKLRFEVNGKKQSLPDIGVLEIKHPGRINHSVITSLLAKYRIFPTGFSKYCTGTALLYPQIKHNRFKPLLLTLKRMHHDALYPVVAG